jgi:O-antigen/teichoic acid export membrane protein
VGRILKNWFDRALAQPRGDGLSARLIRGGLGSAGIQALNRILALALGIVLARGLGAEGYGTYAYAFAIMSLLMVAAEAGVPTLLLREVAAAHGQQRWGLLRGALIRSGQFVLLASVSVSVVGLLMLWAMAGRLSAAQLSTMLLVLLMLPLAALTKTIASAMRGLHRVVVGQAVDMLLRPMLVLLGVGSLFLFAPALRQPQYAMAAQLAAAGVVLLVGGWMLSRYLPAASRTHPAEYQSRQWLKSALPFTLIGGAGIINNQADIIMLGWFRPPDDVGVYRIATQAGILVWFVIQAAQGVLSPAFSQLYSVHDMAKLKRLFRISSLVIFIFTVPVALVLVVFGQNLISFIFGHEYLPAAAPLAVLAVGYLLNVAFGPVGLLLQMVGREKVTAKILWLTVVVNLFLNFSLIPPYGATGAAFSTSVSVVMYHGILRYIVWREIRI